MSNQTLPINESSDSIPCLSSKPLAEWRGSLTTFPESTPTNAPTEFVDKKWADIVCFFQLPEQPQSRYFTPSVRAKSCLLVISVNDLTIESVVDKLKADSITYLATTNGMAARLIISLDRSVSADEYTAVWHGFNRRYLNGQADTSGSQLYELQRIRLFETAERFHYEGSVASADALIAHQTGNDVAQLFDDISNNLLRFIVMDIEQVHAVTLWIVLTWLVDHVEVLALLIINAPEKACGKSQLLDLVGRLSANPLSISNMSTAALFRVIESRKPTILIDEVDTFIRENNEIKGLLNAGHTKSNAFVMRVVGDNHEPTSFSVWAAKALAGIALEKHLPDATMSRGIVINMRRKMPHESAQRIRHAKKGLFEDIASRLAVFANDYSEQVKMARPELPDELSDRAQDNWEPLLAIAECAGDDWVQRAIAAALKLSSANDSSVSIGNELLTDIQQIFLKRTDSKICTTDLIEALIEDSERPWATYNRGRHITPRQLASLLKAYSIQSKTVRFRNLTPKGYDLLQFEDAFARYLPPKNLPQRRNEPLEPMLGEGCDVSDDLILDY